MYQKPGPQSVPGLLALNELRREAVPMKGCGRGETGYPPPTIKIVSIFAKFPPIAANRIDSAPLARYQRYRQAPILDPTEQ
jgi:hypothetical protein